VQLIRKDQATWMESLGPEYERARCGLCYVVVPLHGAAEPGRNPPFVTTLA
jgi:hypothetical protein